jgi:hypothetical protein
MTKLIFPSVALIAATMLATSAMARETHVSSRHPSTIAEKAADASAARGVRHIDEDDGLRGYESPRCVGPLGKLLRAHDSLGSMTNAPGTTASSSDAPTTLVRPDGANSCCREIRVARRSENASPAQAPTRHRRRHAGASAFPTVPHGPFYVRPMANSHPAQGQVIKTFQATTAFLISRSRRQCAQGLEIKFQHCFNNHRAHAPAASLPYDGDTRPSCEMLWSTRNVSNGKTEPGCTDAPYSTKLSMRYPGNADHDPRAAHPFPPGL